MLIASSMAQPLNWTRKADLCWNGEGSPPPARTQGVSFTLGDKPYVGLGRSMFEDSYAADLWRYEPGTDAWVQLQSLPASGRLGAVAFTIAGKAYVGLGLAPGSTLLNDLWEYDPAIDQWTQKASLPATGRLQCAAFSVGGKGYVVGGRDLGSATSEVWEYDPVANAWAQRASYPSNVHAAAAFTLGSLVYVCGGNSVAGSNNFLSAVWAYEPVADAWQAKAALPAPRGSAAAFAVANTGFVVGGRQDGGTVTATTFAYDPVANAWAQRASLVLGQRESLLATAAGGFGWVGMGESVNDWMRYDPVTDQYTARAWLGGMVRSFAMAFQLGGKGYVTGGYVRTTGYHHNDLWAYDPGSDTWERKADFPGAARRAAVAFTIGGKAYITTGWNGATSFTDTWAYDPASNTWAPKAAFPGTPRRGAFAFVIGPYAYVGGGGMPAQYDMWRYDPATDTWTEVFFVTEAAWYGSVAVAGNKAYIACLGQPGGSTASEEVLRYDPASPSEFPIAAYLPDARYQAAGFQVGSKLYCWHGSQSANVAFLDMLIFDTEDLSFSTVDADVFEGGPIGNRAVQAGAAFALDGVGYVFGGHGADQHAQVWAYAADMATGAGPAGEAEALRVRVDPSTASILLSRPAGGHAEVLLHGPAGAALGRWRWPAQDTLLRISAAQWAPGIYTCEVRVGGRRWVQRLPLIH
jgi:N-acetylneuraminic acid mutarotase